MYSTMAKNFNGFNSSVNPIKMGEIDQSSYLTIVGLDTFHHLLFCIVYVFFIIVGILFNLIVILTYKFYDQKSFYQNNSIINYTNKIVTLRNNMNDDALIRHSLPAKSVEKIGTNRNPYVYGKTASIDLSNFKRMSSLNESIQTSQAQSINDSNKFLFKFKSKNQQLNQNASFSINTNQANQLHNSLLTLGPYGVYSSGYNRIKRCSYFILSLSCCDLIICSLNMPLNFIMQSGYFNSLLKSLFLDSSYSSVWCKLTYFLMEMPIVLEIELLLMIAIDRYASVFHPMNINVPNNKRLILAIQILISSLITLPAFALYASNKSEFYIYSNPKYIYNNGFNSTEISHYQFVNNIYSLSNYCKVQDNLKNVYKYYQFMLFLLFIINLLIITTCYLRVYKHVYKASQNQRRDSIAVNHSNMSVQNWQGRNSATQSLLKSENLNNFTESNSGSNDSSIIFNSCRKESIKKKEKTIDSNMCPKIIINNDTVNKTKFKLRKFQMKIPTKEKLKKSDNLKKNELSKIEESIIVKSNMQLNDCDVDEQSIINLEKSCAKDNLDVFSNSFSHSNNLRRTSFPIISEAPCTIPLLTKSKTIQSNLVSSLPIKQIESLNLNVENFEQLKNKASLAGRIRRFSDNQNSSMVLLKKPELPERSISNSLLELSKTGCSNTTSNRVSIRKHTSKPLKHSKTAKLLSIATLAFAFTWLPYWIYVYILKYRHNYYFTNGLIQSTAGSYLLMKFLKNSFYLNYILNPIFYSFVNKRFRQNLIGLSQKSIKVICCGGRRCFVRQNRKNSKITTCSSDSTNLKRNLSQNVVKSFMNKNTKLSEPVNDRNLTNNTPLNVNSSRNVENNNFFSFLSKHFVYFTTCCSKKGRNSM